MFEQSVGQLNDETFGPDSYNGCSYVYNNPTNATDPSGFVAPWRVAACLLMAEQKYETGLKNANARLDKCLAGAQKMCPGLGKQQIELCTQEFDLGAAASAIAYAAASLGCITPGLNPFAPED